jgi:hypothetical protein
MLPGCARWFWVVVLQVFALPNAWAQRGEGRSVGVQMRHVDFHVDSSIVLHISYLRGELQPTSSEHPPYFDDKRSFVLAIDTARIAITPGDLGDLLDHYTFAYPGSPLHNLTLSIEKGQLKQQGTMRGISFTIVGDLTLTPEGELRLHPTSIKAVGIGVGGLMKFLGLRLDKLVKLKGARGVRIQKDDFFLSPPALLPPPSVKGRLAGVEVNDSEIVQVFQPDSGHSVKPLAVPDPKAENYMFYRGGVLRFGKLTMNDADLLIEDAEPRDPFDFFLDQYNAQLVAGYSKNRPDHGLVVVMQDFKRTPPLPAKAESGKPYRRQSKG